MKWADWADRAAARIDRDQLFCEPDDPETVRGWAAIIREEDNNHQIEVLQSAVRSVSGGSGGGVNGRVVYGRPHAGASGGSGGFVVELR